MRQLRRLMFVLAWIAVLGCAGHARMEGRTLFEDVERYEGNLFSYGVPRGWQVFEDDSDGLITRSYCNSISEINEECLIVIEMPVQDMDECAVSDSILLEAAVQGMANEEGFIRIAKQEYFTIAGRGAVRGVAIVGYEGTWFYMSFLYAIQSHGLICAEIIYSGKTIQEMDALMGGFIQTIEVSMPSTASVPEVPYAPYAPSGNPDWHSYYSDVSFNPFAAGFDNDARIGAMLRVEGRMTQKRVEDDTRVWTIQRNNGETWDLLLKPDADIGIPVNTNVIGYGLYAGFFDRPSLALLRYEASFTAIVDGVDQAALYESMSFEALHQLLSK